MQQKFYLISLALILLSSTMPALADAKQSPISEEEGSLQDKQPKTKSMYYELVHENLRPEADEFYVNSIFSIKGMPKASIARSKNKRSGDLYKSYVTYGIGESIADGLTIENIDTRLKEIIVYKESTKEYFGLTMGYGKAKSRLVKKPNYQPKAKPQKANNHEPKPEEAKQSS